jgi:hypothetical protein
MHWKWTFLIISFPFPSRFVCPLGHCHWIFASWSRTPYCPGIQFLDCQTRHSASANRGGVPHPFPKRRYWNHSHHSTYCQWYPTCIERLQCHHSNRSRNSFQGTSVRSRTGLHYATCEYVPWVRTIDDEPFSMSLSND